MCTHAKPRFFGKTSQRNPNRFAATDEVANVDRGDLYEKAARRGNVSCLTLSAVASRCSLY